MDSNGKNLRQNCRDRLFHMFREIESVDSSLKVCIVDEFTVKTLSYSLKNSEVQQVDYWFDLHRNRQPFPKAIYFIRPTEENVNVFLRDMGGKSPLYSKVFLFFSSPLPEKLKTRIKSHTTVRGRIQMMREMNLEYLVIDSLGFITNNGHAFEELFKSDENKFESLCLDAMAARIATVFVSLKEYPVVRYRATKTVDTNTMTYFRDLIPTKLAALVLDYLMKYKETNPNFFPATTTCELLILDRSIDQIVPFIHGWTYEVMCHDLLRLPSEIEPNLFEDDSMWHELRHSHIADVYQKLHEKVDNCARTMLSKIKRDSRGDTELSTSKLANLVCALPHYEEQKTKLELHVDIAAELNELVKKFGLQELGQLEQDLVVGDAGVKDVIKYLHAKENTTCREHKLRLMMILASIYPEVFEGEKGYDMMKVAELEPGDMNAVYNMRLLGESFSSSPKSVMSNFSSKLGLHEKCVVKENRAKEEETKWKYSNFYPVIEELVEKLSKGELSNEDFPCLNGSISIHDKVVSRRTRQSPKWVSSRAYDNVHTRNERRDFCNGPRIFVFIAGGATRSELRVCHKLTTKLKRQIILGSSSLDDPATFIQKMKLLKEPEHGCSNELIC